MSIEAMTDRELLELAAKAAGLKIDKSKYNGGGIGNTGFDCLGNAVLDWHNGTTWNPLDDDGDALRLAVRLGIDLLFTPEDVEAVATQHVYEDHQEMISSWACESWTLKPQDPYAATRRAIVRAAAEIGKQRGKA